MPFHFFTYFLIAITSLNLLRGHEQNKPTVYLLGVQSGGTDSMFEFLKLHKNICAPHYYNGGDYIGIKEPHFFDSEILENPDRDHYFSVFIDPKCIGNPLSQYIDSTPIFHRMDVVAKRMSEFYTAQERSKLKFVVLLREPISRDVSWYNHVVRDYLNMGINFTDVKTFDEVDKQSKPWKCSKLEGCHWPRGRYMERSGHYVEYFEEFSKYFNRSQLLVFNSEFVFTNTPDAMRKISSFLGIKPIKEWLTQPFPYDDHLGRLNSKTLKCVLDHVPPLDCRFKEVLLKHYAPLNEKVYKWIRSSKFKPSMEPPFKQFDYEERVIPCVNNTRAYFNEKISKTKKISCK